MTAGFQGGARLLWARSEALRGFTLLSPTLFVVVAAMAVPLALMVAYSFWSQSYVTLDTSFTLKNYQDVFSREIYRVLFLRSVGISALVTLVTVLLAYPIAYFVAFDVKRHKLLWLILLTLPFWTSYLLRVFSWKVILGYNGVINSGLMSLGLISEPLQFLLYNPFAVIVTLAHAWAAFAILPIYVSLEKIDRTLLEAATDLGDGPVRRFFRVTLPLSMPGVIAASVLIFIPTVGDYVTPTMVGGTGGVMIANIIQAQFGKANNWPLGSALAITTMLGVTAIACLTIWLSKRGVASIK
ncbi:spermidine/putrescine transport system permease protein [Oceanibaculum indicum]|uniref:Spermidine/putrescine transport system permease protein n=2 Tax=Oceanibaculum indicum TaxID=526216 RepID=A0A420WRE6_9PROT|nr:spermidine/putrescine transport system permease protein [Oceanibaculum indicum]